MGFEQNGLLLFSGEGADISSAQHLAQHLKIPCIIKKEELSSAAIFLQMDRDGLSLIGNGQRICGDFSRLLPRLKSNNLSSEMLIKAAKKKDFGDSPVLLDATAGLGEDSLLLAAAGFRVELYEYNPVIAALLADALRRAAILPELAPAISRMTLHEENSISAMRQLTVPPDIILLDPMFPERQKSALVKKKFQLLHYLECPCNTEEELLQAAMEAHPHKIIIKRPLKGAFLANQKPGYSLFGKAIRYDCIVLP